MQVAKYTFQSPYSSPVQVGKLDPNSVEKQGAPKTESLPKEVLNETVAEASEFQERLVRDVEALGTHTLDVYA